MRVQFLVNSWYTNKNKRPNLTINLMILQYNMFNTSHDNKKI
jgi:hypothetical protein